MSHCFVLALVYLVAICRAQNSVPDYLDMHNVARSLVGIGNLSWDVNIAAYAQSYANQRAEDCALRHSGGPYGENIFWGYGADYTGVDAVNAFVDEKRYYDYGSNSCATGQDCSHYTQVVWRRSARLGCARVRCNNGDIFITCNYDPRGNYVGQRPY